MLHDNVGMKASVYMGCSRDGLGDSYRDCRVPLSTRYAVRGNGLGCPPTSKIRILAENL